MMTPDDMVASEESYESYATSSPFPDAMLVHSSLSIHRLIYTLHPG